MPGTGRMDKYFGEFGGAFIPESFVPILDELEQAFENTLKDKDFQAELESFLKDYVGRPSPLYRAENFSRDTGLEVYLKREDLNHTGAHKINNAIGQILIARRMGKKRIIAETGAGQHGVATATAAAMFGMKCTVYMGAEDIKRQMPNVNRMKLLGTEVVPVTDGSCTLKDAMNEAFRDWLSNVDNTYYLIGSVAGPHPYPTIVREFQAVIGREARQQMLEKTGRLPDIAVACVGGGSNAMGLFHALVPDQSVRLVGVEAGGRGLVTGQNAATLNLGRIGVLHGSKSRVILDEYGQVEQVHSISAGLDYPGVGPELAHLHSQGRLEASYVTDDQALEAFQYLCRVEGIIPALESSHAVAWVLAQKHKLPAGTSVLVNLSGRGDKDLDSVMQYLHLDH